MAIYVGQSGAYQEIVRELRRHDLTVSSISEIVTLLDDCLAKRSAAELEAIAEFRSLEREYQEVIDHCEEQVAAILNTRMPEFERKMRESEKEQNNAAVEIQSAGSFFRVLFSANRLLSWLRAQARLAILKRRIGRIQDKAIRFRRQTEAPLLIARGELSEHRSEEADFIAKRLYTFNRQVDCLKRVVEKGGLAGAAAELEIMDTLKDLSDDWYVLNDVNLRSDRWIRFEGTQLRTAQIDHLVVGPGGVFVIETKNWSKEFAESGEYHNPFHQIARSSYLCHRLLKKDGFEVKTRGIIVTKGRLPDKPKDSYAKVLRPDELCHYLEWIREELSPTQVRWIADLLCCLGVDE